MHEKILLHASLLQAPLTDTFELQTDGMHSIVWSWAREEVWSGECSGRGCCRALLTTRYDSLALALGCRLEQVVHVTDQQVMLELMRTNIQLNGLQEKVKASVFDWGAAVPADLPSEPEIILAADCVYFEPAFALLRKTLRDLIGERTLCYFCFKKRRRADLHFMKSIRKDFLVETIDDDPCNQEYARQSVFL